MIKLNLSLVLEVLAHCSAIFLSYLKIQIDDQTQPVISVGGVNTLLSI